MIEKLKEIFGKTDDVFRKYPMVLLMALLGAISLITFAHLDFDAHDDNYPLVKFALVACTGISLMFGLKMLSERIGKLPFLEIAGVLFLAFYYFLLPKEEKDFTEVYAYVIIPITILAHLFVAIAPFTGKNRELNFWQYNKNLFINFFLTVVFTGVLTGGVELAILAVDNLFDFNFEDKLYAQTFFFFSIFGSCFIFLLFNEKGLHYLERDENYPVILKFFTQYVLIPLLLIYAVILYFYSAKILINWQLPRGWVSYLILAYSVVGILANLLVHPLKDESTKSWVKVFSKIFYYTLVPLIVLLFTAIFTRILEYGYTEPRYFVLLLSVWLSSVVLYFIFIKNPTIKFIPVSLFVFGIFALIFPYFNTFSVAKRSQKTELKQILEKQQVLENGTINFNKKISDTVVQEVVSKFQFLAQRKELAFLNGYLKKEDQQILSRNSNDNNYWNLNNDLRNKFKKIDYAANEHSVKMLELYTQNGLQPVTGFEFVGKINSFYNPKGVTLGNDTFRIDNQLYKRGDLRLLLNDKESLNISPYIYDLFGRYKNQRGRIEVPELSTTGTLGNYEVKIIFENLVKENYEKENFYFNDGYVLLKRK